jgi:hypothetical protein
MANSYSQYAVSGTTYAITFDYLKEAHITVYVDSDIQSTGWSIVGSNVVFAVTPTGTTVTARRTTPRTLATQLVDFADGAVLTESDLDTAQRQLLYVSQESFERDESDNILPDTSYLPYGTADNKWDATVSGSARAIKNVQDDSDTSSAVTRGYVNELALHGIVGNPKTFTGTLVESVTDYTLVGMGSQTYIEASMLVVSLGGVLQVPGADYTILGVDVDGDAQIHFATTPLEGDAGETYSVVNFGSARLGGVPDGSVTTIGLADDSVTAAKLADNVSSSPSRAVTANHIQDSAVTTTRIADDAVTAAKLATDSVTGDAIAADSLTFSEMKGTDFYSGDYFGTAPYVLKIDSGGDLTAAPLYGTEVPDLSVALASLPLSSLAAPTDNIQMGDGTTNYQVKNLQTPTADSDAATKSYVDGLVGGSMKVWSTGAVTAPTGLVEDSGVTVVNVALTSMPTDIAVVTGVSVLWVGDESGGWPEGIAGTGLSTLTGGNNDIGTATLSFRITDGSFADTEAPAYFTEWGSPSWFPKPSYFPLHGQFTTPPYPISAFGSGFNLHLNNSIGGGSASGIYLAGTFTIYLTYITA